MTTLQTMQNSPTIPRHLPDGLRYSSAALVVLSVTHIMSILVLLPVGGVEMQQYII